MGQTTEPFWKLWLLPLVVVTAGVIFPVWWWTIPNWSTFAIVVHHFDVFWQIGSNRQVILLLVLKVISPLPITLLLLLVLWLWYLAQPLLPGASAASGETESDVVTRSQGVLSESPSQLTTAATAPPLPVVTARAACEESVPTAHLTSEGEHAERTPHLAHVQEQLTDAGSELSLQPHEAASMQQTSRAAVDKPETPGSDSAALLFDPTKKTGQDRSDGDSAAVRQAFSSSTPSKTSASSIVEENTEVPPVTMTIWLLARVRVAVHIGEASLPVSLPENAKRTLLLAYVASRCGEPVLREKLLEEVFGHGRADEQASPEKLGELFDSHKKLLRREVRATVKKLGASLGIQVPADKIDPFELLPGSRYRLSPWCRVIDLGEIEAQHQIIEAASRDGLLEDHVPEAVKAACDRLLTAYTGDFLEDLLTSYPEEFDPIVSSWVRVPFTRYRDYYFQALWYAAEYERQMGEDEGMGKAPVMDADQSKRRQHWYQAAQFYRRYALDACKNRCDLKVTFNPTGGGQGGERVVMSERAFRRCLSLYGALSATHLVDEVHTAYIKQMRSISSKGWEPTAKTREVLQRAKDATNAHQWFSSHKKVTPHESSVATTAGQAE